MQGLGTIDSPYIITQPSDFELIRINLNAYFELGNDIDFAGADFTSIGASASGSQCKIIFDGKGYTIKNVNVISGTGSLQNGFFGNVSNAVIQNVKFENMTVNHNANSDTCGMLASVAVGQFNNIHVQGKFNLSGKLGRVGGVFGTTYETVNRLQAHNIYTQIEMNITNATASSSTVKNIGGVFGIIVNDNTTPSLNVSNIVANNLLNISNPDDFVIGRIVGQRNYQTTYNNVYANISHFDNNYTENFNIVTDATILNPLTLDSNYWIQNQGELPQLKLFAPNGNRKQITSNINFGIASVSCNVSKKKVKGIYPIQLNASVRLNKQLKTMRSITTSPYNVSVHTTNAKIKSYKFNIPLDTFSVEKNVTKSIVSILACPVRRFNVTFDISYPNDKDKPIYAITSVIENTTFIQSIQNPSNTYVKENQSNCEVI